MSESNHYNHRKNGKFAKKKSSLGKPNLRNKKKTETPPNFVSKKGRRVIDIDYFAEQMWCTGCEIPLSFKYLVEERLFGLASIFFIKCNACEKIYEVKSSTGDGMRSKFHVNYKLALGKFSMLDTSS